jgi:hypothetical protein
MNLCVYVSEEGVGNEGGWGHIKCTIVNRSCRIHRVCIFCENEWGSEEIGVTKCYTEKHKCQFHHSIRKDVPVLTLLLRDSGKLRWNLVPITTKNVRSTMLYYSLYKERWSPRPSLYMMNQEVVVYYETLSVLFVYLKVRKRELLFFRRLRRNLLCCLLWINKAKAKDKIYMGCRCYERLQPNTKGFTHLAYTELVLELFLEKCVTKVYPSKLSLL